MKREHIDWPVLRGALIAFLIVVCVSAAIAAASYYFRAAHQQEYARAQAGFNSVSSQYLMVDEQEKLILEYYPQFLDLYQDGVIGPEQRLAWLESLQRISDNLEIPGLRYQIDSQQQSDKAWPVNSGKFAIYSSNMKLDLEMMHEVDLLRLLNRLEASGSGFFSLSDCEMSRRSVDMPVSLENPNVNASCNLQWYSIKLGSGEEIKI